MEDLLSLAVIILYLVISVSASKKKKERKKAEKRAGGRRPVQFDQAFERAFSQISEHLEQKKAPEAQPLSQPQPQPRAAMRMEAYREGDDPCHEGMLGEERASLYAKTVTQRQMAEASEGEDPCHVGSAPPDTQVDDAYGHSPIFDTEDADAFAQDVLRGVIMSEILTRPGARRGYAGGKRGA